MVFSKENKHSMATTYNRRINLYINGKEVKNDIASIRKEMYKLTNEQNRMTIGSKEYQSHATKIKSLRGIMQKHNADLRKTKQSWFSLQKAADKFNRYFALVGSAIAGLTGTVLGLKQTISKFAEFDDKLADVMKTTGLTKEEVKGLNEELKKIDTRTGQLELLDLARVAGKLGITGEEEILGFVRAANQISVALGEDLGGTDEAVRELGKLTDIFHLKDLYGQEQALLKVGSAINELGMASTANEGYLVEFSKRTAGIAPQAGVSVQNILGLAATLDSLGQTSEVSSTAYSKLMTTMTKKTSEFAQIAGMELSEFSQLLKEDANEAMIRVFEGLNNNAGGFDQLVVALGDLGIEGQRMTSVFGALAKNTTKLREQQQLANEAFAKGTSLTDEYNIKNRTAQAELEKARKKLYNLSVELGERLMPAMTMSTNSLSYLIKALMLGPKWIKENQVLLIALAGAFLAYNGAIIESIMLQTKAMILKGKDLLMDKVQLVTINAKAIATRLMVAATGKATFAQKRLIVTQRNLNAAMNANPIGLVILAFTALVAAIKAYDKYNKEAREREEERKKTLEELNQVNKMYSDQQNDIGEQMKNLNRMSRNRKEALQGEIDKTIELTEAELLLQRAKQEEIKQQNTEATLWQKMVALNRYGLLQLGKVKERINEKAKENGLAAASEMEEGIDALEQKLQSFKEKGLNLDQILNAESIGDSIGIDTITGMEERLKMYQLAMKNYVIGSKDYIRVQQKITEAEQKLREARGSSDITPESSDISKLIEADIETQRAAINAHFVKAGEGAFDAFMEAIEKRLQGKKIDVSAAVKFQKEEEEEKNPTVDYALEQYQQSAEFQLALNQSLYDQKLIGEQEYQDRVTEITRKAEEERYRIKQEKIDQARQLTDMAANFVFSMMDLELAKAGENEEKKKQIKKKYANMQFLVTSSQIIVDTAAAIMKALAELGPIAGPIAAGIIGATGALQLGVANAERNKIQELATGKYNVTGESGKEYNAKWAGRPKTGMYGNTPHLGIFNEVPGQPEMVIDGLTTRKLRVNFPEIMNAIHDVRDGRIPQFAGGKYQEVKSETNRTSGQGFQMDVERFERAVDKLMNYEPKVELVITDVAKRLARLEKINEQNKLN